MVTVLRQTPPENSHASLAPNCSVLIIAVILCRAAASLQRSVRAGLKVAVLVVFIDRSKAVGISYYAYITLNWKLTVFTKSSLAPWIYMLAGLDTSAYNDQNQPFHSENTKCSLEQTVHTKNNSLS